jgi:hypothetical protein
MAPGFPGGTSVRLLPVYIPHTRLGIPYNRIHRAKSLDLDADADADAEADLDLELPRRTPGAGYETSEACYAPDAFLYPLKQRATAKELSRHATPRHATATATATATARLMVFAPSRCQTAFGDSHGGSSTCSAHGTSSHGLEARRCGEPCRLEPSAYTEPPGPALGDAYRAAQS